MAQKKKKIGLLLASIHTGVSQNIWASFADRAVDENISFFIFPGGRLNARQDFQYLRNQVFFLANEENLDGCISWSSSIRHNQSQEEFEHFHAGFETIPYVTIGFKVPEHPCVTFNSYKGMKTLVNHCIQVHNAKKIAFLRGPEFHSSGQSRYEGYCDALMEAGIAPDTSLISDHFDWGEGDAAAAQLLEGHSLIPGRDFDTLVCASDMMALGAIEYFSRHGYHVPADYHVLGYNNSAESRIAESPLSTVHLPYTEMSVKAFKILLGNMGRRKNRSAADLLLESEPVIRESCGCRSQLSLEKKISEYTSGNENTEKIIKKIVKDYLELENDFKFREQLDIRARYEKERWNTALNSLKCDLLGTRDRFSLLQSLARHLPKIGISTAGIVLYSDEKTSIFVGGFSGDGIHTVQDLRFPARLLVPALVRQQYNDGVFLVQPLFIENRSLGYFVHNVSIDDGVIFEELRSSISYALKGIISYEEMLSAKLAAEQAERAKTDFIQALESGLYSPFQGVMDRLESLEKKLIGNAASGAAQGKTGFVTEKRLINDFKKLKSFVTSREAEAGSILDITSTRIDEISLQKTLFSPEELLPQIGTFPLLLGDTARLAQCFSFIREFFRQTEGSPAITDQLAAADYSAELCYGGLSITFTGKRHKSLKSSVEKGRSFGLQLAEQIIRLHGGSFILDEDHCTVTLPWTTLTGQSAVKNSVSFHDHVLVLSDAASLPANFFTLPQILDIKKILPGRTAFIVWNASGASSEEMVKIASLRRNSEFAAIPFLCYGMPKGLGGTLDSAASLLDAIDFALKSPKKGTILFIGSREYWGDNLEQFLSEKETRLEKIRIDSMSAFNETVGEVKPLLIIFNTLDIAGAAAVRRHPLTVMVPILMIGDRINNTADVMALSQYSRLLICHRAAVSSPEFQAKIQALIGGSDILPPYTGVLVKKTILYFGQNAKSHISRWKLADAVNVSEDYLTRIFHREMGLSLWDYLNRYRIFLAAELLQQSNDTIQDIALKTGFQDQAYFCRVFKKLYGLPPGKLRKQ